MVAVATGPGTKISVDRAHRLLGCANEEAAKTAVEHFDWELTGNATMDPCKSCAK